MMHTSLCKCYKIIGFESSDSVHNIYSLTRVKFRGTVYTKGMVIVKMMTNDTPELQKISDIVLTESRQLYFVLCSLQRIEYWGHYHAYTYQDSDIFTGISKPEDLHDFHAYTPHFSFDINFKGKPFVVLKYFLCE